MYRYNVSIFYNLTSLTSMGFKCWIYSIYPLNSFISPSMQHFPGVNLNSRFSPVDLSDAKSRSRFSRFPGALFTLWFLIFIFQTFFQIIQTVRLHFLFFDFEISNNFSYLLFKFGKQTQVYFFYPQIPKIVTFVTIFVKISDSSDFLLQIVAF